ncbi:MAG: Do family serine endopeptidase [Thermoanaerobaculia bacterium]
MSPRFKQGLSIVAIVIASVAAGMILTADFGFMRGSQAQQLTDEGTIPAVALPSFADVAERVMPAVVSITSTEIIQPGDRQNPRGMDPFDFFFGPRGQQPQMPNEERAIPSGGSGFIISPDGYIITNNHVIDGASRVQVHYAGGDRTADAKVVGRDPATDMALLKIESDQPLPHVRMGDSDKVRVGDWAIAIGSPLQFQNTLTVGVVSAKGRALGLSADASFENFIQTDAAINRGNSGGPLLNLRGEVIGINTAISGVGQNLGFAVPVNVAKRIYPQLRDSGRVVRGHLGITIQEIDERYKEAFGLPNTDGVLVQSVTPGSPAEKAGIERGDVVIRVDDVEIQRSRDLIDYVSDQRPGTRVRVQLLRDGKQRTITATTGERPGTDEPTADPSRGDENSTQSKLGISVQELTPQTRRMFGIGDEVQGVLIAHVRQVSPSGDAGLADGDVIVEINGQAMRTPADVQRVVEGAESGSYLRFYISRTFRNRTQSSYVPVQVP